MFTHNDCDQCHTFHNGHHYETVQCRACEHAEGAEAYEAALVKAVREGYEETPFRDSYATALMTEQGWSRARTGGWSRD